MSENLNPLMAFSNALADAASKAGDATVLVSARRRMPASGVHYAPGLVLTANHTIEREEGIPVLFGSGAQTTASLVGRDPASDLAVLRLEQAAGPLIGRSAQDGRVGQLVLSLGRPSEGGIEASLGVISSVGGPVRMHGGGLLERFLRTDTIPYPGFSGGPLVDAEGLVLGINTSGLTPGSSLTIPASLAWSVAETLAQHGKVRRGFLGVRSQPVELPASARQALGREQASGLLLVGVDEGSPAAQGGLMLGDVLVGLAGQTVEDPDALLGMLSGSLVGASTAVEILRGGQPLTLSVVVGERK